MLFRSDISTDHTAEVHCHFEDYDKNLLPGMYMNAEIQDKKKKTKTIPESAIVLFEGKSFVFTESAPNRFEMKEVQTGDPADKYREVRNADELEGKKIVTQGAYALLMSLKNTSSE